MSNKYFSCMVLDKLNKLTTNFCMNQNFLLHQFKYFMVDYLTMLRFFPGIAEQLVLFIDNPSAFCG